MAEFPAMPLWTDAYLADTRHLSDSEHGRYLLMLIDLWRMPDKRFPNDPAWLARKFHRSPESFEREIKPLLLEFFQCDGNWWCQKKLVKVWNQVQLSSSKQSERAKSGWIKRKGLSRGNAGPAYANARARGKIDRDNMLIPDDEVPCRGNASKTLIDSESLTSLPNLDSVPSESETDSVSGMHSPNGELPLTGNGRSKPKAKAEHHGTRLPEDWEPGRDGIEYAKELGLSADQIRESYGAFMRYWLAKAGQAGRKLRWDLTWQTWVRNDHAKLREQAERDKRWAERRSQAH